MAANGSWLKGGGGGSPVDVTAMIGDDVVAKAFAELVELGPLVSLGTTRDGGALAVTVTVEGEWRRDYFRDRDELVAWLAEAIPAIAAEMDETRPSAAPRPRKRRS